uniref:Axoneme-associated protein mst101(2)-like n=1 Tax=Saccoglossus kowalevskii TaxID=10224 RepID=A0ABM0MLT4_SACKO|nr:PREDICTED: axoneme-associated protein mst101(2)-like [Saccoglossus kowalevskii]
MAENMEKKAERSSAAERVPLFCKIAPFTMPSNSLTSIEERCPMLCSPTSPKSPKMISPSHSSPQSPKIMMGLLKCTTAKSFVLPTSLKFKKHNCGDKKEGERKNSPDKANLERQTSEERARICLGDHAYAKSVNFLEVQRQKQEKKMSFEEAIACTKEVIEKQKKKKKIKQDEQNDLITEDGEQNKTKGNKRKKMKREKPETSSDDASAGKEKKKQKPKESGEEGKEKKHKEAGESNKEKKPRKRKKIDCGDENEDVPKVKKKKKELTDEQKEIKKKRKKAKSVEDKAKQNESQATRQSQEISDASTESSPTKSDISNINDSPLLEDTTLPEGWTRKVVQRKSGKSAGKYDVYILSPEGKKYRSRIELAALFMKTNSDLKCSQFDFTIRGIKNTPVRSTQPSPKKLKEITKLSKQKEEKQKKASLKPAQKLFVKINFITPKERRKRAMEMSESKEAMPTMKNKKMIKQTTVDSQIEGKGNQQNKQTIVVTKKQLIFPHLSSLSREDKDELSSSQNASPKKSLKDTRPVKNKDFAWRKDWKGKEKKDVPKKALNDSEPRSPRKHSHDDGSVSPVSPCRNSNEPESRRISSPRKSFFDIDLKSPIKGVPPWRTSESKSPCNKMSPVRHSSDGEARSPSLKEQTESRRRSQDILWSGSGTVDEKSPQNRQRTPDSNDEMKDAGRRKRISEGVFNLKF